MRSIIAGILGLFFIAVGSSYCCNLNDNATKKEIAKMCPAVSPALVVDLKQADPHK